MPQEKDKKRSQKNGRKIRKETDSKKRLKMAPKQEAIEKVVKAKWA